MRTVMTVATLWMGVAGILEASAVEEARYDTVQREGDFELREYAPQILAEVIVDADVEDAGNLAFRSLFRYISGENEASGKIDMTAPVAQEPLSKKIAMTAPVAQERSHRGWAVSFMMPDSYTMETLPRPRDERVYLRKVPARRMAAVRYSGRWSEDGYRKHKTALERWLADQGLEADGEAVWARYDPPFKPWFMRRNEVLIPVGSEAGAGTP